MFTEFPCDISKSAPPPGSQRCQVTHNRSFKLPRNQLIAVVVALSANICCELCRGIREFYSWWRRYSDGHCHINKFFTRGAYSSNAAGGFLWVHVIPFRIRKLPKHQVHCIQRSLMPSFLDLILIVAAKHGQNWTPCRLVATQTCFLSFEISIVDNIADHCSRWSSVCVWRTKRKLEMSLTWQEVLEWYMWQTKCILECCGDPEMRIKLVTKYQVE